MIAMKVKRGHRRVRQVERSIISRIELFDAWLFMVVDPTQNCYSQGDSA